MFASPALRTMPACITETHLNRRAGDAGQWPYSPSGQDVVEATGCLFRKEVLLCEAESPPNSAQVAPGGGLSTAVKTPWTGSARSAENGSCHPLLAARLREASVPRVEGRILAQNCLLALTHTLPSGTTVCSEMRTVFVV